MYTYMPSSKSKCKVCSKKCLSHKTAINCSLCCIRYHPKCVNLTPNDINQLVHTNILTYWTCPTCTKDIFPLTEDNVLNIDVIRRPSSINHIANTTRETCKTCSKFGNKMKMTACWLCDSYSHTKCSAGALGCKSCLREIHPGYDVTPRQLHSGVYGHNNAKFNPYHRDHESNYIGDRIDTDVDFNPWDSCSNILDNCNYYENCKVKPSKGWWKKSIPNDDRRRGIWQ